MIVSLNNNEVKAFNSSRLEKVSLSTIQGKTKAGKTVDKYIVLEVTRLGKVLETHKVSVWKTQQTFTELFEALETRYPALPEGSVKTVELWDIDSALARLNQITAEKDKAEQEALEPVAAGSDFNVFDWYDKQ